MPNPDLIRMPFAQNGEKNTIPVERATGDPVYRASLDLGFPPDTRLPKDLGGEAPDGLDFNGIFYLLSQAIVFLQQGNDYQFDADLAPYSIGALIRSNDDLTTFQSTIANNSNNPNTNMTGWRVHNGLGFIVNNLTTADVTRALSAAQGKALNDKMLGVDQSWQNVTSSRSLNTTYTNTTGKPISVCVVNMFNDSNDPVQVFVGGLLILSADKGFGNVTADTTFIVPVGATYRVTKSVFPNIQSWAELR